MMKLDLELLRLLIKPYNNQSKHIDLALPSCPVVVLVVVVAAAAGVADIL